MPGPCRAILFLPIFSPAKGNNSLPFPSECGRGKLLNLGGGGVSIRQRVLTPGALFASETLEYFHVCLFLPCTLQLPPCRSPSFLSCINIIAPSFQKDCSLAPEDLHEYPGISQVSPLFRWGTETQMRSWPTPEIHSPHHQRGPSVS